MNRLATILAALCVLTLGASRLHAAPEPAAAAKGWSVEFTHGEPEAIAVKAPTGEVQWYWYIPYKAVNNSKTEVLFVPEFTIANDTGEIAPANTNIPLAVFNAVKERIGNTLLESPTKVYGRLLIGEDAAKESVIIWRATTKKDVDYMQIFVAGLSGEIAQTVNPVTGETILLRRTLSLTYQLPGAGGSPQDQPVLLRGEKWIMR